MGFMDSYKHLEKLCGEVMNDSRRISAYIDEMVNTPRGARYVQGWDEDLKQLKHYRWVRNQIVHDPQCTEDTMCNAFDVQWLQNFYTRIINRTDPLALYAQAMQKYTKSMPRRQSRQIYTEKSQTCSDQKNAGSRSTLFGILLLCYFIAVIIIFVLSRI